MTPIGRNLGLSIDTTLSATSVGSSSLDMERSIATINLSLLLSFYFSLFFYSGRAEPVCSVNAF
jgi:hypothetical protein